MLLGLSLLVTMGFPVSGHLFMKYWLVSLITFKMLFLDGSFCASAIPGIIKRKRSGKKYLHRMTRDIFRYLKINITSNIQSGHPVVS
jgi:hypothetical protein